MMGSNDQKGIIPRLCDTLFSYIVEREVEGELTFKVEVSYMEIYNEKVKDLLNPSGYVLIKHVILVISILIIILLLSISSLFNCIYSY